MVIRNLHLFFFFFGGGGGGVTDRTNLEAPNSISGGIIHVNENCNMQNRVFLSIGDIKVNN